MTKNIRNTALLALINNSSTDTDIQITESLQLNRNTYYALFRVYHNGKIEKHFRSTGIKKNKGTQREAKEKMAQMRKELEIELIAADANISNPLFVDYIEKYINNVDVRATTRDGYKHMFNKHMKPYFEKLNLRITDIKPMHLSEYYTYLQNNSGLSSNTARKHHQLIHVCLQDAFTNELLYRNPADIVKKPEVVTDEVEALTEEQLNILLELSKGTVLEMPIYLAIYFGLRRSEVLGLKWSDIDFTNKMMRIRNGVTRQMKDGKLVSVMGGLKTKASKGIYHFSDEEGEMHLAYLKRMKEKQDGYYRLSDEHKDFVCVNELGKRLEPDYVSSAFHNIIKKLSDNDKSWKDVRFHDLRHSCISLLANDSNFTAKQVQGYARHASYQMTNKYSHLRKKQSGVGLSAITNSIGHKL